MEPKKNKGRPKSTVPRSFVGVRLPTKLVYELKAAIERENSIRRKPLNLSSYIEELLAREIVDLNNETMGQISANAEVIRDEESAAKRKARRKR